MSKRIVFIAPYPHDQAPSQRFRFEQYFEFLEKQGFQIEFHPFLNDKTWKKIYLEGSFFSKIFGILGSFGRRILLLFKLRKSDKIFIHREASMVGPPIFEWIIAKLLRRKYIYDFDDAIWLPNYSESNAKFHKLKAYKKIKKIIKWADQVSAGNQFLQKYALDFNPKVRIIPTTIDLKNVHNLFGNRGVNPINIGWTGTHTTMSYLNKIVPVIEELSKTHQIRFTIISNQKPDFEFESLNYIKWNKAHEISDLAKLDIGLMPLTDNIWAEGKCGFKALQYMALGIPAIVSPVGVNTQIIEHKRNGFICDTNDDWKVALTELINDSALRAEIGTRGRDTVENYFSVQVNSHKYLELFDA